MIPSATEEGARISKIMRFYQFILLSSLIKTCTNIDNVWIRTGRFFFIRIQSGIMNFQQFDLLYNLLWCVIIVLLSPSCVRFIFFLHVLVISGVDILLELSNMCGLFDVEFLYIIPANEISKTLIWKRQVLWNLI